MDFKEYWHKHCPTANRVKARKLWNMYEDVSEVSTDFEKEDMFKTPYHDFIVYDECISLGSLQQPMPCQTAVCTPKLKAWPTEQKGNNPMYIDNDKHIESSKINYLTERASTARYGAYEKITAAFNLDKPQPPKTPEALVDAITSGNYTVIPKADRNRYHGAFDSIIWRAPTVVADPVGADAARKVFDTLYKSTTDAIMISTPAEALTAVQALDAWTPVAGTVAS